MSLQDDMESTTLVKVVISGVLLNIESVWFRDDMPGVVDAHRLTRMIDGKKEQNIPGLLSFGEVVLPSLGYVKYDVRPYVLQL